MICFEILSVEQQSNSVEPGLTKCLWKVDFGVCVSLLFSWNHYLVRHPLVLLALWSWDFCRTARQVVLGMCSLTCNVNHSRLISWCLSVCFSVHYKSCTFWSLSGIALWDVLFNSIVHLHLAPGVCGDLWSITVGLIVVCLHFIHVVVPITVRKHWSPSDVFSLEMSVYEQSTCMWFLGSLNVFDQSQWVW